LVKVGVKDFLCHQAVMVADFHLLISWPPIVIFPLFNS
jgi:hypothetical protein